jgi:dimeric dUTPase (all-alpha-NTP-PPase superfamily)
LTTNSQLSSTQIIQKKSDSNLNINIPELLNKTSSFGQNDSKSNKQNSMISEEYEKVNSKYVDASVFDAEHSEAIIFSFAVYVC